MTPRVFIGCSSEYKSIAEALHIGLSQYSSPTIWDQGQSVFELTSSTLESLEKASQTFDFAVLLLTADDITQSRGQSNSSPRDNVILELGLFLGSIGRPRTFIIFDQSTSTKIPSDLLGITTATINSSASGDTSQVVATAVYSIGRKIRHLGPRKHLDSPQTSKDQIALLGSTSDEIEKDKKKKRALSKFYSKFVEEIERTPFGLSTCGPEPVRTVLFDLWRKKLDTHSKFQLEEFEQRVRWYWRKGGPVGLNYVPPVFKSIEAKNQTERRKREVDESSIIVAIAGRTGTRDQLEELVARDNTPSDIFSFSSKPVLLLGWFGGATMSFLQDYQDLAKAITKEYQNLSPLDELSDWWEEGRTEDLVRNLILTIRRLHSQLERS